MQRVWLLAILLVACYRDMDDIEADAMRFAELMDGKPPRGVQCMNVDSDNDGYVTCTVFRGTDRDPYSIQCAVRKGWQGCKATAPRLIVPSQTAL